MLTRGLSKIARVRLIRIFANGVDGLKIGPSIISERMYDRPVQWPLRSVTLLFRMRRLAGLVMIGLRLDRFDPLSIALHLDDLSYIITDGA